MLEFLAERAKQSKWIRKPTRMLKLVPLEKEAETIEEACEKELEGIVEDTEKNTQLVLKVNKDFYPVRDCAIHTILKRAGINGTGLKKLEKATYAKVVNYCLQVAKGDALIKVADEIEIEMEGEWETSSYGTQYKVETFLEVVPRTREGILGYIYKYNY